MYEPHKWVPVNGIRPHSIKKQQFRVNLQANGGDTIFEILGGFVLKWKCETFKECKCKVCDTQFEGSKRGIIGKIHTRKSKFLKGYGKTRVLQARRGRNPAQKLHYLLVLLGAFSVPICWFFWGGLECSSSSWSVPPWSVPPSANICTYTL